MTDCRRIESLLPPYVDGDARASEAAEIERHLAGCEACRSSVVAQRSARYLLQARGRELAPPLPPGLRTRMLATLRPTTPASLGWGARASAFAAAAVILLAVIGGFELLSPRSNVLYAAQLAIDHVRCFVVEMAATEEVQPDALEKTYAERYGWSVQIPPSNEMLGLRLVAARRCPFWLGRHAHALYRIGDREVSLYIDQGSTRSSDELHVLGHTQNIWQSGQASYALIARGVPAGELGQIAAYLQAQTRQR